MNLDTRHAAARSVPHTCISAKQKHGLTVHCTASTAEKSTREAISSAVFIRVKTAFILSMDLHP